MIFRSEECSRIHQMIFSSAVTPYFGQKGKRKEIKVLINNNSKKDRYNRLGLKRNPYQMYNGFSKNPKPLFFVSDLNLSLHQPL